VTDFGARPLVANMSSPAGIHRVDPRSSLTTSVVTAAEGYTVLAGITLAPNGLLFAVDSGASQLVRINPRTDGFGPAGEGITSNDYAIAFDWFRPAVIASDGDAIFSKLPGHAATREIPTDFGFAEGLAVEPPTCAGKTATIVGTPGRDRLVGSSSGNVIAGLGGRDVIRGKGGRDILCGGGGRDTLIGGPGRDTLIGGRARTATRAARAGIACVAAGRALATGPRAYNRVGATLSQRTQQRPGCLRVRCRGRRDPQPTRTPAGARDRSAARASSGRRGPTRRA
jgi:hypothetical protein